MLYVTTRDKFNPQTAPKALSSDRGDDGGLFVPFQMPTITSEELSALPEMTFGQSVSMVLNAFLGCKLSASDVDFSVGRLPVKLCSMNHRVVIAETWRNVAGDYARTEDALAGIVCANFGCQKKLTSWLKLVIRTAVLFGVFGELIRSGYTTMNQIIDVSVPTADFSAVMSVWYGRMLGLPIGNIICSCNENSGIWELLHLGELRMDAPVLNTTTPLADCAVPTELERLVHAVGGIERVKEYIECKHIYRPAEELAGALSKGMFSAVVSRSRLDALIPSVYRTNSYVLGTYTALAYGGLMDYRAKTGETRSALLIAERSPICDSDVVCDAMRIRPVQLRDIMTKV